MAKLRSPKSAINILSEMVKRARLLWHLLHDERAPLWIKLIPVVILLYILSPIDLIPDPILGLGQLDDIAFILLGLKLLFDLYPAEVMEEQRNPTSKGPPSYVDAEFRVIEEDEE